MKKKIAAVALLSMLVAGTVHASSINGDFNGNPIVKLKHNGQVLPVEDAPPIVYEGRTMVPIYMLKQLGVDVTWDQETYSVDVKMPSGKPSLAEVQKQATAYGVDFVIESAVGDGNVLLSYNYSGDYDTLTKQGNADFANILYHSTSTDATIVEVYTTDDYSVQVPVKAVSDFTQGKITAAQLGNQYVVKQGQTTLPAQSQVTPPAQGSSSQSSYSPTPAATPSQTQSQPTQSTSPSQSQADAKIKMCQDIDNKYVPQISEAKRQLNPFNGRDRYDVDMLEAAYANEKSAAGC